MQFLTTMLAFLVAVGLLILVHELGHYAVARACGVKVLRFSVGFGRPLWRRVAGPDQTEWVIAAIPYGGYVKMLDERAGDDAPVAPADLPRAFNRQSVGRRSAIVAAGPAANLAFAVLMYWLIHLLGTVEPLPYLAAPPAQSPAALAGVREGDLLRAVEGQAVQGWGEARWALMRGAMDARPQLLELEDLDGRRRSVHLQVPPGTGEIDEAWFEQAGLARGAGPALVRGVLPGGAAQAAGVQAGDRILAIDGQPVQAAVQVMRAVRAAPGRSMHWSLERAGQTLEISLTPATVPDPVQAGAAPVGRVGADFLAVVTVREAPLPALTHAIVRTWETVAFSLRMAGRMLTGQASWHNLSGPVSIADVAGQSARVGLVPYLGFLALVSISLGVLNLLPIPILDGGHLLYHAVEVVTGSPPSGRVVDVAQRIGLGLLLLLTALALYNDVSRLLSS
jgi:regulator of sigma E protease